MKKERKKFVIWQHFGNNHDVPFTKVSDYISAKLGRFPPHNHARRHTIMSNVKCILTFFFSRSLCTFLARIQNFSEADKKVKEIRKTKRMTWCERWSRKINFVLRVFYLLRVNAKNLPNFNFLTAEKVTQQWKSNEDVRQRRKKKRALESRSDLSIKKEIVTDKIWRGKDVNTFLMPIVYRDYILKKF